MSVASTLAATAYEATKARLAEGAASAAGESSTGMSGFADILKGVVDEAFAAGVQGEAAAMQAVVGQGDLVDAVTAITAAEVTLQTVVAVRDRVIGAYQEIMRMPI